MPSASFPARKRREDFLGSRVALTAAREHLIRNRRTRRKGREKSSFHPCERSSCIRIQSRSFRYVRSQTFSPFHLPTDLPPSIPPTLPVPASPLTSSHRFDRSPVTARRHVRARVHAHATIHACTVLATDSRCDVAWTRRDEARCCQTTRPAAFPRKRAIFRCRSRVETLVRARFLRLPLPKPRVYIPPFFRFPPFFSRFIFLSK